MRSADLLGELGDTSPSKQEGAGRFKDQVAKSKARVSLMKILGSENIDIRRSAVKALGRIGAREALTGIAPFLQHKDSELRANAVEALGRLGDTKMVGVLAEALYDGALEVRINAVKALGNLGDSRVLRNIMDLPLSASPNYRERELKLAIVVTFGKLGDDSVISRLDEAMGDSDWRISRAAAHSLKQLKSPAALQVLSEHGHSVN